MNHLITLGLYFRTVLSDRNQQDRPSREILTTDFVVSFREQDTIADNQQNSQNREYLPTENVINNSTGIHNSISNLSVTKKRVERKKLHSCRLCCKAFLYKSALTVHERFHIGEKPYTCTICNRSLTRQSHLKEHLRSHYGEKPFACSVCSKSFNRKTTLKSHKRIHTGEKPYICELPM